MRRHPEVIVLIAIVLGIAGGGAAYYFWRDLWICLGVTFGSLFSSAFILDRAVTW